MRVRLYRPGPEPLPLVVFVHGGGFVFGDLESHNRAAAGGWHGWPARPCSPSTSAARPSIPRPRRSRTPSRRRPARPDALGALTGAPALAGDSSGGTIALLAARELARRGTPASALWLACPNADLTLSQRSVREKGSGWGLEADALAWFVAQWLPAPAPHALARFSPLHADLAGLPPTLLATAEHDPLRDEGEALAARLREAGVGVDARPRPGDARPTAGLRRARRGRARRPCAAGACGHPQRCPVTQAARAQPNVNA